ncbi:MAG: ABC transporter permease subunit/CPBP intramembrane protease [Planctomycetaceae bacterium]
MSAATGSTDSTGRTLRLAGKELREILRDRRTVMTLVLMPLLVYPVLGVMMRKGLLNSVSLNPQARVHVCLQTEADAQIFTRQLSEADQAWQLLHPDRPSLFADDTDDQLPPQFAPDHSNQLKFSLYVLETVPDEDLRGADAESDNASARSLEREIEAGRADLAVRLRPVDHVSDADRRGVPFLKWQLITAAGSVTGAKGADVISEVLRAKNDLWTAEVLESHHLTTEQPAAVIVTEVRSQQAGHSPFVTFIPLVLVLMTMTGAVYPAIDLTAGERERGTMEILVAAPVSRMTVLAGKFVAVLTVALLTAMMNLISMFITLFALGLEGSLLGQLTFTMIVQVVVLMVVFAAFFSAVLLSITSVARSFKEAQAYLVPLMLISLTPGIFSLMPDLEISGLLAVTPLVNTVLMGRDLLLGNVSVLMFAIVLISTALYGVLALSLAARIFGSDSVLYGSAGSWAELFRRPKTVTSVASPAVSLSCLAVVFSLFIVVGSVPARLPVSLTGQLLASAVTSILLFAGIPLLAAVSQKVSLQPGFALNRPPWTAVIAAILLGVSVWPFVYELEVSLLTSDRIEYLKELFESFELNLKAVPLSVRLLSLAIVPAVCEELFFRGFLQNSIRRQTGAALSIVAAAVLFGLFHVIVKDALLFERLIPSTLMGLILGTVFERARSVIPGMLLHVLHNGFLVAVSAYEDELQQLGIGVSEHQHLPTTWLLTATVPVMIAARLLWHTSSANQTSTNHKVSSDSTS